MTFMERCAAHGHDVNERLAHVTDDGPRRPRGLVARSMHAVIRLYRLIPHRGPLPRCRYSPSCSEYGLQALEQHGAIRGAVLISWRILRCNPFTPGGFDPVPAPRPDHARKSHS